MRMHRRAIFTISIWLATGAALTIGLSWAIAAWMPLHAFSQVGYSKIQGSQNWGLLGIQCFRGLGWQRREWKFFPANGTPAYYLFECVDNERGWVPSLAEHPKNLTTLQWGRAEEVWQSLEADSWQGCDHASGWPLPALWYEYAANRGVGIVIRGGFELPRSGPSSASVVKMRALPLHPIWAGFAVDSVFWGSLLWLFSGGPKRLRQVRRFRRNHCPRCNYDLCASPITCPECGWNHAAIPATPSIQT